MVTTSGILPLRFSTAFAGLIGCVGVLGAETCEVLGAETCLGNCFVATDNRDSFGAMVVGGLWWLLLLDDDEVFVVVVDDVWRCDV
jgi:hypothetical protein